MLVLFDQRTPVPLREFLTGHTIRTAAEQHWTTLENGLLLDAAEAAGFHLLPTTDKNIRYQQNLAGRRIGIVALGSRGGRSYGCTLHVSSPRSTLPRQAATRKSTFQI
jgi:hypothetical protein